MWSYYLDEIVVVKYDLNHFKCYLGSKISFKYSIYYPDKDELSSISGFIAIG